MANEKDGLYKLTLGQRIGYGIGDTGQNLIYQVISGWLLYFYTNVYGLDPTIAGLLFLFVRCVDVVWDPIVGTFVDKHHPKMGKYRAYLILGGIPLTILAILCFWYGFRPSLVYAVFTYVGLSMCYTFVNVPYCSLNSALTRDPEEVVKLSSIRMFLAQTGAFVVFAGLPLVISIFAPKDAAGNVSIGVPEAAGAWFITMTIYALVGMALFVICYATTKEQVVMDKSETAHVKVRDLWKEFFHNEHLFVLSFFFITAFTLMSISNSVGAYYMQYNVCGTSLDTSIFSGLAFIPSMIFLPLVPAIKKRMGKKPMMYTLYGLGIVGSLLLYVVSITPSLISQLWIVYTVQFIKYTGIGVMAGYMWALVPEVVAYAEYRTGRRIAGIVYAVSGMFFKAGVAIGGAIPGIVLGMVGFNAELAVQNPLAEQGILWLLCFFPAVLMAVGIFIMSKYNLSDEKLNQINEELADRKKKLLGTE